MMNSVSRKEKANRKKEKYLTEQEEQFRKDQLDFRNEVDIAAEHKIKERSLEIFRQVDRRFHVPKVLVLYSIIVTIFLVITYEPDFASVKVFGEKIWHGISQVWETGWPFVFGTLKDAGSNDLTAWMLTIITAMFAALLAGWILLWILRIIIGFADIYSSNNETAEGAEITTAVIVTSVLASLIITGLSKTEMTWVGLALIIAAAGNLVCHSINVIKNGLWKQKQ